MKDLDTSFSPVQGALESCPFFHFPENAASVLPSSVTHQRYLFIGIEKTFSMEKFFLIEKKISIAPPVFVYPRFFASFFIKKRFPKVKRKNLVNLEGF